MRIVILFIFISFLSTNALADFEIREACTNEQDAHEKRGEVLKFYASLLAYNNEKPRCLLIKPIVTSYQVSEAVTHNDPVTNDVIVDVLLTEEGKNVFSQFTNENDKEIALVIENKILAMFTVLQPINDGKLQIRGLWYEDAIRLRNAINQK